MSAEDADLSSLNKIYFCIFVIIVNKNGVCVLNKKMLL